MSQHAVDRALARAKNLSTSQGQGPLSWATVLTVVSLLLGYSALTSAADVGLQWDPVGDERVALYEVHWGTESGAYQWSQVSVREETIVANLLPGETYYFAVRACAEAATLCSAFSSEVVTTPEYDQPTAHFTLSSTSGQAPHLIEFSDESTGIITSRQWDFGDGKGSSDVSPTHIYTEPGTYTVALMVSGPGGSSEVTYPDPIVVAAQSLEPEKDPPIANFTESTVRGSAPLSVEFTSLSTGEITDYRWDFGDGTSSTEASPTHVYHSVGTYTVSLTVSGPDGSDQLTLIDHVQVVSTAPVVEVGEVSINHDWHRVDFEHAFTDPVVIVKPLSNNDDEPAVARVSGIDSEGFWVRVQEWDYLDGAHLAETVGYIVMERGLHQLPDGSWIEASLLEASGAEGYVSTRFTAPFASAPALVSSIVTTNDTMAVTTRLRAVDSSGFQVALQKEEASAFVHGIETVAYIAWEPSSGEIDGLRFEVAHAAAAINDAPQRIVFGSDFGAPPVLIADMQTTNGGDTANLRWQNKDAFSAEIFVSEEQSQDSETRHVGEGVGYIAIANPATAAPIVIEAGGLDVDSAWQRVDLQNRFTDPVVIAKVASAFDTDPAGVSIDGVDSTGFWIRLREWDYQDDVHLTETVSFFVVERGRHQLPNGAWLEAGRVDIAATDVFNLAAFSAPFGSTPVVLTSLAADDGASTLTARLRRVALGGFEIALQQQEANPRKALVDGAISYIAWEPSSGELDGLWIEVGHMPSRVDHELTSLFYATPSAVAPTVLADMQTTNGGDTASLRMHGTDGASVDVWVQEEQSKDPETSHVAEEVGYLVIYDDPQPLP